MTHAKRKRQPLRQVRVLMLSTLTVLLCSLLSQAQVANNAGPQSPRSEFSGTGTADYIPLWLTTKELGSSKMFQSTAGNIGVGTTSPAATLDVNGAVNAATSFNLGDNAFAFGSFAEGNAFLGFAGNSTMTGTDNTASGFEALHSNTSGYLNTVSGYGALYNNTTGYHNTVMGSALYSNTTGYANTAMGNAALFSNTTGVENTAVGASALSDNSTACCNTATGYGALAGNTTGTPNTATGTYALYSNTTGTYGSGLL
jgi:trimeric autotransporter adhesin